VENYENDAKFELGLDLIAPWRSRDGKTEKINYNQFFMLHILVGKDYSTEITFIYFLLFIP